MNPAPTPLPLPEIAPPVEIPLLEAWQQLLIAAAALVLLGLLAWLVIRAWRRKPVEVPPTAREIALRQLQEARGRVGTTEPREFSILVSDILRSYLMGQFRLPATRQTSQEFISSARQFAGFSPGEKALLEHFLQRVDEIKFAQAKAGPEDSHALLEQAADFVGGPVATTEAPR